MKLFLLLTVVALAYGDVLNEWFAYKKQFNKDYSNGYEELNRMNIFFKNKKLIEEHNAKYLKGQVTFTMKVNHLTDMETEEVKAMLNGYNKRGMPANGGGSIHVAEGGDLPDSVDWRDKHVVTGIKDQKQCGSCWAFSAVGSIEGQHAKQTGYLVSLSEQNLVDCSGSYGNFGCGGGWMDQAFMYVIDNGIDTEDSYPYTSVDGTCKFDKNHIGANITGYVDIRAGDENALKSAVATVGPVSVAIDAGHFSFQSYAGGIYTEKSCSPQMLDHGVLAVGYGTENGQDYWLVKNSWGLSWGEQGYIKMARNKNNMCGIATKASYPTV